MDYREMLPRRAPTRRAMMKRVARFSRLKGFDGGLPDSHHPSAERTLYNVIGFQPPRSERGAIGSPVGRDAARNAAVKISEGFNLGYCRAKPGKGPMMHNHDTNETFVCMTGVWRASWLDPRGREQHVDLRPLDLISFPAGAIRRFMNLRPGPGGRDAILMFVIGGDAPNAEFSRESMAELESAGLWPAAAPRARRRRAPAGTSRGSARRSRTRRRGAAAAARRPARGT